MTAGRSAAVQRSAAMPDDTPQAIVERPHVVGKHVRFTAIRDPSPG